MRLRKRNTNFSDRRKYIRLDTVLPVQFALVGAGRWEVGLSDWMQGFTRNVSKEGFCLEINNLCAEWITLMRERRADLSLKIELPFLTKEIPAIAKIVWMQEPPAGIDKFLVGLHFEKMEPQKNILFLRYARIKKLFLPVTLTLIIFFVSAFAVGTYLNLKLLKGNRALVRQLVAIVQESSIAKQKVKEVARQRAQLELGIQNLDSQLKVVSGEQKGKKAVLAGELNAQRLALQERLIAVQKRENAIAEDLLHLDKRKAQLERANLEKMYQWLQKKQQGRTGLLVSFEGTDNHLAFIYDQALALLAFTNFADFERAQMILDFFSGRAKKVNGLFVNAYSADSGIAAESLAQAGPNLWLGIGILQYTKKSLDKSYLAIAEDIARGVIALEDSGAEAYNPQAYSFFTLLYELTGKPEYRLQSEQVLSWLLKHLYDNPELAVVSSAAVIGPEKLEEMGINPERAIEFAQERCAAEVVFCRPEGYTLKVKGFDFAPEKNLARGGIVSSEWTAQMVIAYKIMSDYYYKKGLKAKGHFYEMKADEYLATLGKMIISSPASSGQSCLPFATQCLVDTGHGWVSPKDAAGCISGTAYTIFAYYNYNPLES